MSAATEFDVGPLTWVKGEIDQALERAGAALDEFEKNGEVTQFKFCRTHVHQVHGALDIVGLSGVTELTEALENLLQTLESDPGANAAAALPDVREALHGLRNYLDGLLAGEPHQPLRILPLCARLAELRGAPPVHPGDFFYPDLSLRPPRSTIAAPELSADEIRAVLRTQRMNFQKGLLKWLTRPAEQESGRHAMAEALAAIEAIQPTPGARTFWWISQAFLEALNDPGISSDQLARQLCARIDLQIRRLLDGSSTLAERVMREALYYVAQTTPAADSLAAQAQQIFDLPAQIPSRDQPDESLPGQELQLRRLRDILTLAEEAWNKYCAGHAASLKPFAEQVQACAELTASIGTTDLKRLGQALAAITNWLQEDSKRHSDAVAMEIATGILLLQNAQENHRHLGKDFAQQVDHMVERIHAVIAGRSTSPADIPLLDEITRRAQEKLLISQVGREIQNNLAHIEQSLDVFFRNPAKGFSMAPLEAPLKQISGALAMLGHFSAVKRLQETSEHIARFAASDYQPQETDFQSVADELSLLGFFVDALANDESDFDAFAARLHGETAAQNTQHSTQNITVEAELAQQTREARALANALRQAPGDARLQQELKDNLEAIQKDADLVADRELGESAKATLAALATGVETETALSNLAASAPQAPSPSAETLQLASSSHEEIDAELLAIFIEEGKEVLGELAQQKARLRTNPHDQDALTTIRRCTHTLKGSGRMVGLSDFGETAWALEQTFNLWLRQDRPANAELLQLIADEERIFSDWVAHLEGNAATPPDTAAMVALATRLRGEESSEVPTALTTAGYTPPAAESAAPPQEAASESLPAEETPEDTTEESPAAAANDTEEINLTGLDDFELDFPDLAPADTPSTAAELPATTPNEPLPDAREPVAVDASTSDEAFDTLVNFELDAADSAADAAPTSTETAPAGDSAPTLYDIFRHEATGHLATLIEHFAILENDPAQPTAFEMMRAAHTLGGIAATVGLLPIHHLAIALEHALVRREKTTHPEALAGLESVRQAILTLADMFTQLSAQQTPEEQPQLVAALEDSYPPALSEEKKNDAIASLLAPELVDLPAASEAVSAPPLTDELDEQLLPIFLEEASDQVRELSEQVAAWRAAPNEPSAPQAIARLLHTFKGNARMAGAMNLGEATHLLETRVQDALNEGHASSSLIDDIEAGCDALAQAADNLRHGQSGKVELPVTEASGDTPAPPVPQDEDSAAPAPAKSVPPPVSTLPEPQAQESDSTQQAMLRVRADLVDRLVSEAGELAIARTRIEGEMRSLKTSLLDLTENVIRLRRQLREIEIQAETQMQARVAHTPEGQEEFDPLELDRFTRFQELTRFMAESVNDVATVQQSLLKNLDDANAAILAQARLNRGLQQELMGVRMLPFASQAERLYRVARQTAKEVGKQTHFEILGDHVEIDRSVLDKMLGPIEHMLRNAVTHGLETAEQRVAAGKPERGQIILKVAQEANEIILSLTDDGRGLDRERIRRRAEELELLGADQEISDSALYDFIFQPGFSTAASLSQVAGRGVGMDVVKTTVANLGGRIETSSEVGHGTTFRLYLPLTLAVTQTLLVRAGSQTYAIPSSMIEQVQEMKEAGLAELRAAGKAEWQGNSYPFHFLPHLLGQPNALPESHRQYWVLLLRSGSQRVGVLVDELRGNQEVVVKNIGNQLARVVGISGATVLGDGRVVLILNPVALASRQQEARPLAATAEEPVQISAPPTPVEHLPTIMVVDDSLTVRKITSRLLLREGYQVLQAKDGVDALEQLVDERPDVILSDVEMPRMDGFDFVRNLRGDEKLRDIPVIMITSRTAEKHRNYALEIGANHYLGKPYDEDTLLGLLSSYCRKSN